MFKNLTTVDQGSIGLTAAIFYYQKSGYHVCLPIVDSKIYDLVIEKDTKFFTVQVKTTKQIKNKSYSIELRSIRPNKTKNIIKKFPKVDYLFALCDNGDVYSIPYDKLLNENGLPKSLISVSKYKEYKV